LHPNISVSDQPAIARTEHLDDLFLIIPRRCCLHRLEPSVHKTNGIKLLSGAGMHQLNAWLEFHGYAATSRIRGGTGFDDPRRNEINFRGVDFPSSPLRSLPAGIRRDFGYCSWRAGLRKQICATDRIDGLTAERIIDFGRVDRCRCTAFAIIASLLR
jgi:hypothetical protein